MNFRHNSVHFQKSVGLTKNSHFIEFPFSDKKVWVNSSPENSNNPILSNSHFIKYVLYDVVRMHKKSGSADEVSCFGNHGNALFYTPLLLTHFYIYFLLILFLSEIVKTVKVIISNQGGLQIMIFA